MKKLITIALGSLMVAGFSFAQSNSTVEQTGNFNESNIQQVGANNNVDIDQGVMNNSSAIPAGLGGSFTGEVTVGNASNVHQKSFDGGVNEAYIYQGGSNSQANGNTSTIDQYTMGGKNSAYSVQYGTSSQATVLQGMDGAGTASNIGGIGQLGDGNTASINQQENNVGFAVSLTHGNSNQSHIMQSGSGNAGAVIQADVAICDILQMVDGESISLGTYGGAVTGNVATLSQSDGFNIGGILQTGNTNTATLTQSGSCPNLGAIYQSGNGNDVSLTQTGLDFGLVRQNGDNNESTVIQTY